MVKYEIKHVLIILMVCFQLFGGILTGEETVTREYNGSYTGPYLNRVAFPIGGLLEVSLLLGGQPHIHLMAPLTWRRRQLTRFEHEGDSTNQRFLRALVAPVGCLPVPKNGWQLQ